MIKQHERNIELEKKAGIRKEYIEIEGNQENMFTVEPAMQILEVNEEEPNVAD